jgi:hypothetical protein
MAKGFKQQVIQSRQEEPYHPSMTVEYGLADRMAQDGRIVKVLCYKVGHWKCAQCGYTLRTASQVAIHVRRRHES